MAAFRLDLIGRYLRPHRRTVCLGAVALVIVNMLSVTIPLEVRRVIDDLQGGFAFDDVLRQALWIVVLASTMGDRAVDLATTGVRRGPSGRSGAPPEFV